MNIKAKVAQVMTLNVVIWFAMLTVFAGLLAIAAGIYLVLAGPLHDFTAAFIAGASLIGLVVIVLAITLPIAAGDSKPAANKSAAGDTRRRPDNVIEQQVRPLLGNQATDWAKNNTGLAVVGALTAGVVLAASPRLRAALLGAAGPFVTRKAGQVVSDLTDN